MDVSVATNECLTFSLDDGGGLTFDLSDDSSLSFDLTTPAVNYEKYEGDYSITPSESEQTLAVEGLLMADDVTIEAVSDTYIGSGVTQMAGQTVVPTESSQTVETEGKYMTGNVTVGAISSAYVGSEIDRNDDTDLTVSGATITAPAGYYESSASKSVASGTEGTPTATKGTVNNNSVSVTPSVTNTEGYISGGTHTGTAVKVQASELVSGTLPIAAPGTHDVTNYAAASVASGSATTPATAITANPSISVDNDGLVTASVNASESVTPTVSEGYVSSGTSGTVVVNGSNTSQLNTMSAQAVTPTESQQTLSTSGKYMTGDVTVNAIPSQYKDMSGENAWMGADAEYVGKLYTQTVALEDTNFASWTPSTTASAIQATASVATFTADMANYDYIIRWTMDANIVQASGATLKSTIARQVSQVYQQIIRRPGSLANLIADVFGYNACMTLASAYYTHYYNSSGTETMAYTQSYGFYQTVQSATLSSTSSDNPTVTVKRPVLYSRCSSTYFATGRASEVDQAESTIKLTADLFRVPSSGILRRMYETLADVYNS